MAKHMISKSTNIKVVGRLDKNDDDQYIISIEQKDSGVQVYELETLLQEMVGTEITIASTDEELF